VARFQREAKVLASLNHQNIATIHGLEQADGAHALVMELVEGEDLAQRIARGAIPIDEALPIAKQIAEALEAAHEQGIIHRDLKPANIKVRPDGTVKVLDFGLAKAMDPPASSPGVSQSPTITTPAMTQAGMILGTAAYMSPEQAKGRPADKRSDVWAFGCVLYEMLTGKRVFEGEDVSDTLANILKSEPEWHALPANLPEHIRLLVRRCLEKDRSRRVSDASIARFLITEPVTAASAVTAAVGVATPARSLWRRALPAVVTAVVVCALTAGAMWRPPPWVPAPVTRFAMALPDSQQWSGLTRSTIAVSPAGTHIVYTANRRLYLRSLSDLEVRPVTGADNSGTPTNPVFSPDGRSIAYFELGAIKRIALSGGAAVTVCQADFPYGMSWDGDTIFFGQGSKGIMRVPANGGKPEMVVSVKTGELAHGPQLLPDGQTLLFTLATGVSAAERADRWDKARIVAESLKSHERTTVIDGAAMRAICLQVIWCTWLAASSLPCRSMRNG
jgi:serine/threonine-protein kinase